MNKPFLIFDRPHHSFISMVRAPSMLAALRRYAFEEDPDLAFHDNGSVTMRYERTIVTYPQILAYIEARHKVHGEWQIRELPEQLWRLDCADLFCGENPSDIEALFTYCLPILRQEFPRVRPQCFVWYLQQGALLTFYRRQGVFRIEIIKRYLVGQGSCSPWLDDYDTIMDSLWGPQPVAEKR